MRKLLSIAVAAAALAGCAGSEEGNSPRFEGYTDWTVYRIARCLPPVEGKIIDSCCEQYLAILASEDKAAIRPYHSFARFDVQSRIIDHVIDGLPIPDTEDEANFQLGLFGFLDSYCRVNLKIGYTWAVGEFWRQVPKPVKTNERSVEDVRLLIEKFEQDMAEEGY